MKFLARFMSDSFLKSSRSRKSVTSAGFERCSGPNFRNVRTRTMFTIQNLAQCEPSQECPIVRNIIQRRQVLSHLSSFPLRSNPL